MNDNFPSLLQNLDALIKSGKFHTASVELSQVIRGKVPGEYRADFAKIARRLNQPGVALRLLNPIVRPSARSEGEEASDKEKAEYAASLIKIGGFAEAIDLLETVNVEQTPEALLFESFALFAQWNYASTIPLLDEYVQSKGLTDYERLVGRVNLLIALVYEKENRAETEGLSLLQDTNQSATQLLYGNVAMTLAEHFLHKREWERVQHYVKVATGCFPKADSLEALFTSKWKAVANLYRDPKSQSHRDKLREIRDRAVTLEHWETLRNCDYHEAVATKNEALFNRVFFGTPYESLRQKLTSDFGSKEQSSSYLWKLGADVPVYDFSDLKKLKLGMLSHRLAVILTSDFYRPLRLATIHAFLYPKEFYNPVSSPPRVRQVVKRLRQYLKMEKLPLKVAERKSTYKFEPIRPCSLRVRVRANLLSRAEHNIEKLASAIGDAPFTIRQASAILKTPTWTTLRILQDACEEGAIVQSGKARATRYHFKKTKIVKAA